MLLFYSSLQKIKWYKHKPNNEKIHMGKNTGKTISLRTLMMERFLGWDFEGANVKIGCITKACLHLFTTVEYTLQNTEQRQPVTKSSVKPLNSNIIIPENKFGWY